MEFEFDKEIDAILRKSQDVKTATAGDLHLDADEISAFAENALPDTTRKQYTAHLAECARCRKILSNVVSLNDETETQEKISAVSPKISVAPWYRRLFAFPQIAYAMGALVLLFSGFLAYVVLQNSLVKESSVARTESYEEKSKGTGGASSDGETTQVFAANFVAGANANANVSATSNAAISATPAYSLTANSTANVAAPNTPAKIPAEVKDVGKKAETESVNEAAKASSPPTISQDSAAESKTKSEEPLKENSDDKNLSTALRANPPRTLEMPEDSTMKKAAKPAPIQTTNIGGKTFRRADSAWVDSEYQAGANVQISTPLTYVSRNSEAYRKLDANVRNIAEKLDGIVIVVWNGRAYRIQ